MRWHTRPYTTPPIKRFWENPRSDYHEKGCFRFGHDDDPFFAIFSWTWFYLSAMMGLFTIINYIFSVTLRIVALEREGIRMVATRRPLGSRVQSPPPPYDSGKEHHDIQQRTSRESSPDVDDWICLFEDRHRSPSTARRSRLRPRGDQNARRGRRG
jgi:hypothetical protein